MKKLTIFFVTNNYKPYAGGVVRSIDTLYKELTNRGHRVYIITLDFTGKQEDNDPFIVRVPCPLKFSYKKNHMAVPWRPHQYIDQLITTLQPDIIHVHHPFLLGKGAKDCAKKHNIPVIFTYHTQYDQYLHYVPAPTTLTRPIINHMVQTFCNDVDGIIVPTRTISHQLVERDVHKPMHIIPSAIDRSFFAKQDKKTGNHAKFQLLTVSRFVPEKNITFLLDAVRQLDPKKFQFTLVGYGMHEQFLKQYAYEQCYFTPNQVRFVTRPTRTYLRFCYQKADLFLFASKTETQGLVLAEAMARGLPVVALDAPGSRDIVSYGINGFLVDSKQSMVNAIKKLVDDYALYEQLSANAINTAHEYKSELIADRVLTTYRGVLADSM